MVPLHRWDVTPAEARALQKELAHRVDVAPPLTRWERVAAVDVSHDRFSTTLHAAVVVVRAHDAAVIERAGVTRVVPFPYVPGLLSFREAPPILAAFEKLNVAPDVILCDGHGIAHPRRLGIACHLGLWLGMPTIGCAKSRLCGTYEGPAPRRGARSPLMDHGEVIGSVVRSRDRVKPLFVSPGHLCDLESAVDVVLALSGRYRLPTPARLAHDFVNELRRGHKPEGA